MAVIKTNPEQTQTIEGAEHGASISLILDRSNPGQGPKLHCHPYDETWLVIEGIVTFQAGNENCVAGPGDVVIVPANTPHKFTTDGVASGKVRKLGIPALRDRIVQMAAKLVLEPIFEADFCPTSMDFGPGVEPKTPSSRCGSSSMPRARMSGS